MKKRDPFFAGEPVHKRKSPSDMKGKLSKAGVVKPAMVAMGKKKKTNPPIRPGMKPKSVTP